MLRQRRATQGAGVVRTRAPPRSPKLLVIGYDPVMEGGDANLMELARRCTLSPVLIRMWVEAATVMLFKFHRAPPPRTRLSLHWDERRCSLHLDWTQPDRQALESHANEKDATEAGAYAVAIAAAEHDGYVVRRRAHQGSGADLLMVRRGEPDNDFVKLEVSGIARGGGLENRVTRKAAQVAGGDLARPGVAIVVHFEAAHIVARGT